MAKSVENAKARAVWFGIVDLMIVLLVIGFVCSLFLIQSNRSAYGEETDERLVFSVTIQSPYTTELFFREGGGAPIPLRNEKNGTVFGNLICGEDGIFYVECELSAVKESEDKSGVWMLGDTVLMNGTGLAVETELAIFSVTLSSVPGKMTKGTAGSLHS
jgi:hypothetical protein